MDFKKELIILGVIPGPNSIGIVPSVDDKGDLKFTLQSTEIGGPGFGYHLVQIKREGVKTINGKPIDDKKNAPAKGDLTATRAEIGGFLDRARTVCGKFRFSAGRNLSSIELRARSRYV